MAKPKPWAPIGWGTGAWSSSLAKKTRQHHPTVSHQAQTSKKSYIYFYGQDFFNASKHYSFSVLSGDQPPTIVGGYAKWQVIDRPLRRGISIFQGYDPISMQVQIRFIKSTGAGWETDDDAGLAIEKEIQLLEWMAGEGIYSGPSPKVWLSTYDGQGNTIPLIPFEYQGAAGKVSTAFSSGDVAPWVVTSMTWDPNPVRNPNGYRIRQDATIVFQEYEAPAGSPATTGRARLKATTVRAANGKDSALLIARNEPTGDPATLATQIVHASQNKGLHLRSVNQKIKHGKKVYVPSGN